MMDLHDFHSKEILKRNRYIPQNNLRELSYKEKNQFASILKLNYTY